MGRLPAIHTLQGPRHLAELMELSTKSLLELCRENFVLVQIFLTVHVGFTLM